MEELSKSFLNAISAVVQIAVEIDHADGDGIDGRIKKNIVRSDGSMYKSAIQFQLKSTAQDILTDEDSFRYQLKAKNYNDLCTPSIMPSILLLLVLPLDKTGWVEESVESLILRKCMYWLSFRGKEPASNTASVTVTIPQENRVTSDVLEALLKTIANGGVL